MVNDAATSPPRPPTRRVVLLGASNLTLGFSTAVESARLAWGQPLEILAAIGHGRSYGLTTRVLGRELPGIVHCGIWQALQARPPLPTAVLVTDIGNDLIYGCRVNLVVRWLETCLARLKGKADRLVVTRLPIEAVFRAPEWRIHLLTSLFFPSLRMNHDETLAQAFELDDRLLRYADRFGAYVVQPESSWYTWDPIHIARRHRPAAWHKYMTCWADGQPRPQATGSARRWYQLQRARPLIWKRFGRLYHRQQPAVELADGTTISLF